MTTLTVDPDAARVRTGQLLGELASLRRQAGQAHLDRDPTEQSRIREAIRDVHAEITLLADVIEADERAAGTYKTRRQHDRAWNEAAAVAIHEGLDHDLHRLRDLCQRLALDAATLGDGADRIFDKIADLADDLTSDYPERIGIRSGRVSHTLLAEVAEDLHTLDA